MMNTPIYAYLILPLLIAFARILDVTLGTIRIMFVSRGHKVIAPILGFFEILIWLAVIRQIMQNLDNVCCYIAYAAGFAAGNLVGIIIEEKMALGRVIIRVITQKPADELLKSLRTNGYGVTHIDAEGASGPVAVLYSIVERKSLKQVIKLIDAYNPKAFYSIENVRLVKEGIFPDTGHINRKTALPGRLPAHRRFMQKLMFQRKSK